MKLDRKEQMTLTKQEQEKAVQDVFLIVRVRQDFEAICRIYDAYAKKHQTNKIPLRNKAEFVHFVSIQGETLDRLEQIKPHLMLNASLDACEKIKAWTLEAYRPTFIDGEYSIIKASQKC